MGYTNKKGERKDHISFGLSEAQVKEKIAAPYMKNKAFLFSGIVIHPSDIEPIYIFRSKEFYAKNIILPNGKPTIDEENNYIINCFLLQQVKGVSECTEDFITKPPEKKEEPIERLAKTLSKKEKIFIVHGRDDRHALRLQKYLRRTLKIEAEMFEDFKERSGCNTIIEQLEYIQNNVGYVIIVVSPDDYGCLRYEMDKFQNKLFRGKKEVEVSKVCELFENFQTRARQNVVFEFGLFMGALGRKNVCCLLHKDTQEKPSDIDGILYVPFKNHVKETFHEITEKLKEFKKGGKS